MTTPTPRPPLDLAPIRERVEGRANLERSILGALRTADRNGYDYAECAALIAAAATDHFAPPALLAEAKEGNIRALNDAVVEREPLTESVRALADLRAGVASLLERVVAQEDEPWLNHHDGRAGGESIEDVLRALLAAAPAAVTTPEADDEADPLGIVTPDPKPTCPVARFGRPHFWVTGAFYHDGALVQSEDYMKCAECGQVEWDAPTPEAGGPQ